MLDRKEQIIEYVLGEWNDTFKTLASEICQNPNDVKLLLELNEHPDQKIAWRTAYLLDLAHDIKSNILEEYLELIMDRTPKLSNQSIKRHYLRILSQHDLSEIAEWATARLLFRMATNRRHPYCCQSTLHANNLRFNNPIS